ncbi:cysteine hydrolase family protein [Oceanisphaera sp. KMM 10153]|uniref:cysteine hydrolase family protein n=1 Tax=Oceanisphaera submarina TaxID=3390193 RepID=UPI003975A8DD
MQRIIRRLLTACALSGAIASAGALAAEHPTIRAMSGATPVSQLPAGKTALLVIDFQNEYFTGRMPIPDGTSALDNTRQLINFADSKNMPVYHVQHIAPEDSAVFAINGQTVKFHPDMMPRDKDTVLQKTTVSVFASTDLDSRLKSSGIENLIITGLMTHACVAGAARDGATLGYNVVVASDASATRTVTRFNGETVDKDTLHKAALAEIEDTFGDVMTTNQILQLPVQ